MLLICFKIFFARILDVSLGTFRTILTIKEKKLYASITGFLEIIVWFFAAKEALNTTSSNIFIPISYALGFATGTYLGGLLSEKFISGNLGLQVITSNNNKEMIKIIRNHNYGVSVIEVNKHDSDTDKYMLFIEINKHKLSDITKLIHKLDPKAFIVVNDTKYVQNGYIK